MKALRALFGLFLIVSVAYLCWMVIPPYFNSYQLEDLIEQEARLNTYTSKSEEDMRKTILLKARDLDLPLSAENIKVQRTGNSVSISADYTVHLNLPLYPLDLKFHPSSQNRGY